jgi:AbrB family looped-hinge helix DNA binding protein
MKALGIIRKIDDLGRIVIPKEVRRTEGWNEGQPMEMFTDNGSLVIKAYNHDRDKRVVLNELKVACEVIDNENIKSALKTAMEFIENGEIG